MRVLVAPLKALGVPLALPTLPGHGGASPEALRGVTWPAWMAAANAALEELCSRAERVIVVGNSMGGLIALQLAADHPTLIDSVVLASAPISSPPRWPQAGPWPARAPDPGCAAALAAAQALRRSGPGRRRHQLRVGADRGDRHLARFHPPHPHPPHGGAGPVLILQGRRDPVVAPASVAILLQELGSPAEQRQVVWFESSLHELFRDGEREAAAACVAGFVQQRLALVPPA